ncbi:GntP family permease [Neorhodopirellula pilleata]|uniref:GntP family permease n=1 Tax=Neorhodopirellula pilleata TaxID=2714738 RepID=UPI0011B531F0|nr:GntP family permease [Neorhodopirellula pilleata]
MSIGWLCLIAISFVLIAILVFRLHAFLALLTASFLVAVLTPQTQLYRFASEEAIQDRGITAEYLDDHPIVAEQIEAQADAFSRESASRRVATQFGNTTGSIGIVIALASVIGALLMHSGAASTIVTAMLKVTGDRRAPEALAAGSFVLGIPVFFDTVFYLMIPIARSLRRRVGKNYVLFILAILAGGSITHSLIPPTPGPLQVAAILNVEIGAMLIAGLGIGSLTSIVSLMFARLINRTIDLPLRDEDGNDLPEVDPADDPENSATSRPPLSMALAPILLPVLLITIGSVIRSTKWKPNESWSETVDFVLSLGDKNIALGIGCVIAFVLMRWVDPKERKGLVGAAIASAGGIILITAAGGSLGKMLHQAGIADAVSAIARDMPGVMMLPLAFAITAAIRTVQGSATIAMITSASVLQGFAMSESLPFHPVYLAMAIGAGSKPVSWMTDSAFWVISEMSGMTEKEALRVISPMSIAMGCSALVITMVVATIFPAV